VLDYSIDGILFKGSETGFPLKKKMYPAMKVMKKGICFNTKSINPIKVVYIQQFIHKLYPPTSHGLPINPGHVEVVTFYLGSIRI